MAKVLGIGGVFFTSKKKKALLAWYQKHLGLDLQDWGGVMFPWGEKTSREIHTVWTPFDAGTKHFGPSKHPYMINYVVDDLDGMVAKLKKARVKVDKQGVQDTEYGKFAWVFDPEGRKVELWEPPRRKR